MLRITTGEPDYSHTLDVTDLAPDDELGVMIGAEHSAASAVLDVHSATELRDYLSGWIAAQHAKRARPS